MKDDLKDLLDAAKQDVPAEPAKKDVESNVLQFMIDTDMKEDPNKYIALKNIHWTYVKWCDFRGITPMHITAFGIEIKKRFKRVITADNSSYFINKDPYQIDDDDIFTMRAYYRKGKGIIKRRAKMKALYKLRGKNEQKNKR